MISSGNCHITDAEIKDKLNIPDVGSRDRCLDLNRGIRIRKIQNPIFVANPKYSTKSSQHQKTNTSLCLSKEKEVSSIKKFKKWKTEQEEILKIDRNLKSSVSL